MTREVEQYVRVAGVDDLRAAGRLVVQADRHVIVLFVEGDRIHAVDNRCPHMGFPLHRGTLGNGILTCHWHHARFDLESGGTFDRWADDVRTYPVQVRDGEVWIDLTSRVDVRAHQRERLREGLEYNIPLVIAKAVISLLDAGEDPDEPFRIGLDFGVRNRKSGWGQGLTILGCMRNILPFLEAENRPRALYHGLASVAWDSFEKPTRFEIRPLPTTGASLASLKQWYRQFIEVRDAEGAERCVVSAIRAGASLEQLADMLLAAATDHRYLNNGHVVDFTNKAFEALGFAGRAAQEQVLLSVVNGCATADRMEESNAWRHPVDLVAILEESFDRLPAAVEAGWSQRGAWAGGDILLDVLLSEDPKAIADGLLGALSDGATEHELGRAVAYGAALRLARFHTSNEFPDWDTALHTFTFANAVQQGLERAPSPELLRGVFDAAMSIYLDRFLNVPPASLPQADDQPIEHLDALLGTIPPLLDRQQQVNEVGAAVARYLYSGGDPDRLLAVVAGVLLREDRNFHAIQAVEAAFRQYQSLRESPAGVHVLVGATRFLAAHSPTVRAQQQTYHIAYRLHRGERLYTEPERILATVLFVDIVGSTEHAAEVGDRRWRELLRHYHGSTRAEIARYQGREVDVAGDGILATFDSPARAIRCARAIAVAARRLGTEIRAGLHTGEIEIMADRVAGICVHTAARVAAIAGAGEVLVTSTIRDLVGGSGIYFEDRGLHTLKGVPGEWHLLRAEPDRDMRRSG